MIPKIYSRSVMRMGREPEHSLMVTIPKRICEKLQIEKGARLYFKLVGFSFVVSKDGKFLDNNYTNNDHTTIESIETNETQEDKKETIIVDGISLDDLQY